jgi:RES domain-containing protein
LRRVWRISKRQYAQQAFTGEGAKLLGGRWNFPGQAVVYTSSTLALAALESFVHLPSPLVLPRNLVSVDAEIPDDLPRESVLLGSLPPDWKESPPPDQLKIVGQLWLARNQTAILEVPSVVIPAESNFLLNPAHPDFQRIAIGRFKPFVYDPRMKKAEPTPNP